MALDCSLYNLQGGNQTKERKGVELAGLGMTCRPLAAASSTAGGAHDTQKSHHHDFTEEE